MSLASAALAVLGSPLAAQGREKAGVRCEFNARTHVLTVATTDARNYFDEARIRRVGDRIVVDNVLRETKIPCGGTPTVINTDLVKVFTTAIGFVSVELEGGPFAPGATPEADGSSEIEFSLGEEAAVFLRGTRGADHFQYLTDNGTMGINLDPGPEDHDVDVVLPSGERSAFPVTEGGPGPDTIDVVGHPPVEVEADGGSGDDTLIAKGARAAFYGAILDGGNGNDRIVGGKGDDSISAGHGVDTVEGLGGADQITLRRDGSGDRVDCGNGHDIVRRPERRDRLRSCERAER